MSEITSCQQQYINELQSPNNPEFRKKIRESNYNLPLCAYLNLKDYAFIVVWQRVPQCVVDPKHSNIINIIKDLARKEANENTDPIPKKSILGTALIALELEQECNLI